MSDYNAGIHSIDGNRLVIVINDMYADYGLARPEDLDYAPFSRAR